MFENILEAQKEVSKLTDEQLVDLTMLTLIEHVKGNITDEQADFVAALVMAEMLVRLAQDAAMAEKNSGATVN